MKLGSPEQFHDKISLRCRSIEAAAAQYRVLSAALREPLESKLDEHTTLFLRGFGNDVNLLAVMHTILFSSRELLDVYLGRIAAATRTTGAQTSPKFVPFFKRLVEGDYDKLKKPIFEFLETNATHVFHIRKFRNRLKTDPSTAEFRFNTNRFEMEMWLPVEAGDEAILPHLEIPNVDKALADRGYHAIVNLDEYVHKMPQFWAEFGTVYENSYPDTPAPELAARVSP